MKHIVMYHIAQKVMNVYDTNKQHMLSCYCHDTGFVAIRSPPVTCACTVL